MESFDSRHFAHRMIFSTAAIVAVLLQTVSAKKFLTNCLDDNKSCVGLPRGCIGQKCYAAYSEISNGTHVEIEIVGQDVLDKTWIAIAYSEDQKMDDDLVLFCIREDSRQKEDSFAGLAINEKHSNTILGMVNDMGSDDPNGFDLKMLEYKQEEDGLYCRMSHRIAPIVNKFNTTRVEILMSKGVWINEKLNYHGKTRNNVGVVNLAVQKKKRNPTSSTSMTFSLPTFLTIALFKLF